MHRQRTQEAASVSRGAALLSAPAHRRSTVPVLSIDDPMPLALTTEQPLLQISNAPARILQIAQ